MYLNNPPLQYKIQQINFPCSARRERRSACRILNPEIRNKYWASFFFDTGGIFG